MKKEIAEIWIAALESGKYEQTTGMLKKVIMGNVGYCCLGVLCDISGLGTFGEISGLGTFPVYILPNGNLGACALPVEVLEWADMSDSVGCFIKTDDSETLSELNDSGYTFDQIAAIIRNNYKAL